MSTEILDKIKKFIIKNNKLIVLFLFVFIIGILISLFKEGYSARLQQDEFNEIQGYLEKIRNNDKDIYNNLEVREIEQTVKGIDVSSFQGDINWEKVKKSGIDFVIIRCGYRNLSNEEIHEDSKFKYNISEANRVGIPAGVYFYSTALNKKEALEEASFVLNLIKNYDITFPVVYDFELFNNKRTVGLSDKKINDNAIYFLDYLRAHGYTGMLYSNLNAINYHWNLDNFLGYKLWYAQYIDNVTYEGKYDMWQYADNGRVDGIVWNVDLNESYFTYEVINRK